jgi:hypothetical protein
MFYVFCDGEALLKKFQEGYGTHPKGFFILAPSGSGKTHFIKNQIKNDWIDGDDLWLAAKAEPENEWWNESLDKINEVEQRCDVITSQAKKLGFWIMGASNWWLLPDAIVLPPWRVHKNYIIKRENNNYDGGAKSDTFLQVMNHRKYMQGIARKNKIPVFRTVEDAVTYLEKLV